MQTSHKTKTLRKKAPLHIPSKKTSCFTHLFTFFLFAIIFLTIPCVFSQGKEISSPQDAPNDAQSLNVSHSQNASSNNNNAQNTDSQNADIQPPDPQKNCIGQENRAVAPLPKIRIASDHRTFVTDEGTPFVPFGVNYFRPGTGWAPQFWKTFDPERFRQDCERMRSNGVNAIRIFLTFGSFMTEKGKVDESGLQKLDQLLEIAQAYGIYVHPTGPDHWEGSGAVGSYRSSPYASDEMLELLVDFWQVIAERYQDQNVIFSYDLLNEPTIEWNTKPLLKKWNTYLLTRFQTPENLAQHWGVPVETIAWGQESAPIPQKTDSTAENAEPERLTNRTSHGYLKNQLLDFQDFREGVAENWVRKQADAIRAADPDALVTVGFIQWNNPIFLPEESLYAAFRPERLLDELDYFEVHFYPLITGFYDPTDPEGTLKNLAYAEALVRDLAQYQKPVVLGEFGWIGGGQLLNSNQTAKGVSEKDQAAWNTKLILTTQGWVTGWFHWGLDDVPEARDITERIGLYTVDGTQKVWGETFKTLSEKFSGTWLPLPDRLRPSHVYEELLSDPSIRQQYFLDYESAFRNDPPQDVLP